MKNIFIAFLFLSISLSNCSNEVSSDVSEVTIETIETVDAEAAVAELNCNKDEIISNNLISIQDAHSQIKAANTIVIEVSKKGEYLSGHLPSAIQVWRPDFRSKIKSEFGGMRCSAEELNVFLQSLGVNVDSELLIYDAKGGCDAMRLAWVLDYYGFYNYQIINGGKEAWKRAGYPLEMDDVQPVENKGFIHSAQINEAILATKEEVLAALRDSQTIVIDTREENEYAGQCFMSKGKLYEYKNGAFSRGCIPNAVHLNWSILSDLGDDHRVKCKKDLEYDLAQKGITQDKNIIVYCQSGSRSSHMAFVLRKILGYPNVKNYDGSWIEWSYYAQTDERFQLEMNTSQEAFDKQFTTISSSLKTDMKRGLEVVK